MIQQVQIPVSKEAYELGQGLVKFLTEMKKALADGWQPAKDLPVLLQAVMADLVPAFQDVEKIALEKDENLKAFVQAFELSATDIAFVFLGDK